MWCADITDLPMRKGFPYLVAIMDWVTRKVLAWRISNTLKAEFCRAALNAATPKFGPPEIMNTDQGSQFTSCDWIDRLKRAKTTIAMDGKARPPDTICIARLWRSLQYECVGLHACTPAGPGRRPGLASGAGSPSTTTIAHTQPMAVNRPPWPASTQPHPISRRRQWQRPSATR
jgi:transposase InsO family protein